LLGLTKENSDIVGELNLKVESLSLTKAKNEKEKTQLQLEAAELGAKYDALGKDKIKIENQYRALTSDFNSSQVTVESQATTIAELTAAKQKAAGDAKAAADDFDASQTKVKQLNREVGNLGELISTLKAQAAKEQEAKGKMSQDLAAQAAQIDQLKQAYEDEHLAKSKQSKALTDAISETANWRSKYEALALTSGK